MSRHSLEHDELAVTRLTPQLHSLAGRHSAFARPQLMWSVRTLPGRQLELPGHTTLSVSYVVTAGSAPELVSDEDDPPLQEDGGEHLQEAGHAEALQQAVEVDVLQPGVHGPTQSQYLRERQSDSIFR